MDYYQSVLKTRLMLYGLLFVSIIIIFGYVLVSTSIRNRTFSKKDKKK